MAINSQKTQLPRYQLMRSAGARIGVKAASAPESHSAEKPAIDL